MFGAAPAARSRFFPLFSARERAICNKCRGANRAGSCYFAVMESHIPEMSASELAAEKTKDYRNILVLQFIVIVIYFTLEEVLRIVGLLSVIPYKNLIFLAAAGAYFFLLWDMLRNFISSRMVIGGSFGLLMFDYFLGVLGENPFYQLITQPRPFYFFIHTTLMSIEWMVIYFVIRDLFTASRTTSDKLWCSACLYLTIGITFGSLYDLLNIIQPGSFGRPVPVGFNSYIEGIYYSIAILGSGQPPYPNASALHRSIGILQSVWNNLYLVLLIGRVLLPNDTR